MSDLPLPEPTPVPDEVLDIQHDTDPAQEEGPARRIPHLGHTLLFFSLAYFVLNLCVLVILSVSPAKGDEIAKLHPGLELAAQTLMYVVTLGISLRVFPALWKRPFTRGIDWNLLAARRFWWWAVPTGVVTSLLVQFGQKFVYVPKDLVIERLLKTAGGAWSVTAFATLIAPAVEEIAFRGFLLPALAIAYDWLRLERTPAGIRRWQETSTISQPALVFGAVFSSVGFALLHAGQLQHAWGMVGLLYCASLVFSFVRIRTNSVACSTAAHMAHNLTIFVQMLYVSGGYRHLNQLQ